MPAPDSQRHVPAHPQAAPPEKALRSSALHNVTAAGASSAGMTGVKDQTQTVQSSIVDNFTATDIAVTPVANGKRTRRAGVR